MTTPDVLQGWRLHLACCSGNDLREAGGPRSCPAEASPWAGSLFPTGGVIPNVAKHRCEILPLLQSVSASS